MTIILILVLYEFHISPASLPGLKCGRTDIGIISIQST